MMSLKSVKQSWVMAIAFIPYALTLYMYRAEHTGFQVLVYCLVYAGAFQLFFSFLTGRTMQFNSMSVAENEHPHLRVMGFFLGVIGLVIAFHVAVNGSNMFSGN